MPYSIYLFLPDPSEYNLSFDFDTLNVPQPWSAANNASWGCLLYYKYGNATTECTLTIPFDVLNTAYGRLFQITYNNVVYNVSSPTIKFTGLDESTIKINVEDVGEYFTGYNITYLDENGDELRGTLPGDAPLKYEEGSTVTLPIPTSSREGYDFVGWYDNEGCTGKPVTEISADATGDKTFYAKWKIKTIKVSLNNTTSCEGYMINVYKGDTICKQIYVTTATYTFELEYVSNYSNNYRLAFVFGYYGNLTFDEKDATNDINTNITTANRSATITSFADTTIKFTLANPRINSTIII